MGSDTTVLLVGRDWLALTKPGIVLSNVMMTAVGLAFAPKAAALTVAGALMGTALLIASCGALNMVLERDSDRRMQRTARRPVAAGRIGVLTAAVFGIALFALGVLLLLRLTTIEATTFGVVATVVYVGLYTPMKRWTWTAVPVGAVAGALPPVIGWFAAGGDVGILPILLFATIFVWQLPHFMAIGIRRWRDYADADLQIATGPEHFERAIGGIRLTSTALVALTIAVAIAAGAGPLFWTAANFAALVLLAEAMRRVHDPARWARRVFFASLLYLPMFALGSLPA